MAAPMLMVPGSAISLVRAAEVLVGLVLTSAEAAVGSVVAMFRPVEIAAYVMTRAVEGDGPTPGSDPWILGCRSDLRLTPVSSTRAAQGDKRDGPARPGAYRTRPV
jgi:hypothetical protein